MLLCSRDHEGEQQFGVVEKFDPESPFARVHGDTDLQMTGNNAFVLLQNYVESERSVLQLFRKDIEATVEENLSEKFPNQNHSRVVRAISARCVKSSAGRKRKGKTGQERQNSDVRRLYGRLQFHVPEFSGAMFVAQNPAYAHCLFAHDGRLDCLDHCPPSAAVTRSFRPSAR